MKKVCVFCGSSIGNHPEYQKKVQILGEYLGSNNYEVIYGGGNIGLMGELARAVLAKGGKVTGIIPKKIYENVSHIELTELKIVDTMHERKALMYELADGFIVLPGGIGTLEELAEAFTWNQLGYHAKPIGLYNIQNFYNIFMDFLKSMSEEGFLKTEYVDQLVIDTDPEQLVKKMRATEIGDITKWKNS